MDPESTWDQLLSALEAGDVEEAADVAGDLIAWLDRLGFPPRISSDHALPEGWRRVVVRAACEATLEMAGRPPS
jgi:hypothetical protein